MTFHSSGEDVSGCIAILALRPRDRLAIGRGIVFDRILKVAVQPFIRVVPDSLRVIASGVEYGSGIGLNHGKAVVFCGSQFTIIAVCSRSHFASP
jgi:hypothetical protein